MGHLRDLTVDTLRRAGLPPTVAEAAVANAWDPPDPVALAHPLADLGRLFEDLRARGVKIAVATSDDRAPTEATLDGLGLAPLVDAIVCADDGLPVKPAPDAFLHLCALLGADASRGGDDRRLPGRRRDGSGGRRAARRRRAVGVGVRDELAPFSDAILGSVADLLP